MPNRQPPKSERDDRKLPLALRRAGGAPPRADGAASTLGEKAEAHPAHGRARTLLNTTFRKATLVQRAAVLEAAEWLITVLDRATMIL